MGREYGGDLDDLIAVKRGPRAAVVRLAPTVRRQLRDLIRHGTAEYRAVFRARIVLLAAAGRSNADIARSLSCGEDTVRKWRERFARKPKLDALFDRPRSGRPAVIPVEVRCSLLKLACDRPPERQQRTVWTRASLAEELDRETGWRVSVSEVGRILNNSEMRPQRLRLWLHSPDPDFRAKARRICELYVRPPPGATVLCIDEKTQIQALRRRFGTTRSVPGRVGRYEFEYVRGGVQALIAALDVRTGQVFAQCRRRRTAADVVAFMEAVARRFKGTVYVVWDNLDVHHDGGDRRWSRFNARHGRRFHFVYTPLHASWLNQVEQWFSIVQRRVLRWADFSDRRHLVRRLLGFVHRWNRIEAHPFRWTFRGRFRQDAQALSRAS